MAVIFKKAAILGLGLIGGSLSIDLMKKRLVGELIGYNRGVHSRAEALKRRACHHVVGNVEEAVEDADLVVLATPVQTLSVVAKKISPFLKPGCLVTDVGSTKTLLVKELKKIFNKDVFFVGGHPIAGAESSGMKAAREGLFKDAYWILTPELPDLQHPAFQKFQKLLLEIGSKIEIMSPQEHDAVFATVSHLPHVVAFALMDAAANTREGKDLKFAATGFKDTTRVAGSSAEVWSDICLENKKNILSRITTMEKSLSKLKKLIESENKNSLKKYLSHLAELRSQL